MMVYTWDLQLHHQQCGTPHGHNIHYIYFIINRHYGGNEPPILLLLKGHFLFNDSMSSYYVTQFRCEE